MEGRRSVRDMWSAASDRDYYGDDQFPEDEEPELDYEQTLMDSFEAYEAFLGSLAQPPEPEKPNDS